MHKTHKSLVGQQGEEIACWYLGGKGYDVLRRNYWKPWGELDIIARAPDGTLAFVEVKTVQCLPTNTVLKPEDNLTAAKLNKLQRAAQLFAGKHPELIDEKKGWQIDLVAICLTERGPVIRHYENI